MNNIEHAITISINNINLRFTSFQKTLIDFIIFFIAPLTVGISKIEPDIDVKLIVSDGFSKKGYNKISRSIWLKEKSVVIETIERFPGLSLRINIKGHCLFVEAILNEADENILTKIRYFYKSNKKKLAYKYIGLIYYLIFFPTLYYLERFEASHILHASAIEYEKKGVIISGLGGVGKTTFALATQFLENTKFISDNLIACNNKKIYPFLEPIAIDPSTKTIPYDIEKVLTQKKIASTHQRMFYQIKSENLCLSSTPKYLFWLQWSNENRVIPLEKDICVRNLLNINFLAKELREYYILAAALDLAFPQLYSPNKCYRNLSLLLSDIDCYILEFKPGTDLKTVIKETFLKMI